jgi:cell division septal protein FtsQ
MTPPKPSLRKFFRRSYYYFKIIVLSLIFLGGYFFFDNYFRIKIIEVDSDKKNLIAEENYLNKNILFLSENTISQTLINNNPTAKAIIVKKVYPDKLIITVVENQPLAVLKVNNGYFLVDNQGKIIYKRKELPKDFPLIKYYQLLDFYAYNAGDTIDYQEIKKALYFLDKCTGLGLKIISIDINGLNMIALHLVDRNIIFTTEKDQFNQMDQLGKIIRQFKISGQNYKNLDFRFDKPFVELK